LFDIEEIIPHSCLAAAKPLIVQATMKAHIPANPTKVRSLSSTLSLTSSSDKENLYKEKEKDKDDIFQPKMNMAVQALMYQNKDRSSRRENEIEDDKIGSYNHSTSHRASNEYKYGNISKSAVR
jgi:hypothetical protein